jgi:phospholipid/cholesterol/gamma-HCH transport system substrate-binding protein
MKRYGELQVGITVLVALVVLVAGVLWFKGFAASQDSYLLSAYFPQASGLDKGDPVEVAGVVQGKVEAILYEAGRAKLELSINKHAELYADARVTIANYGMMGQKFVAIEPGTPERGKLDISRALEGGYETGIGDMLVVVGRAVETMQTLAERINDFMASIDSSGGGTSIGRTVKNVERFSGEMAELASETKESLKTAISNFDAGARELKVLLNDKGPALRGTIDNFARASSRVDTLTAELSSVSRQIHDLVGRLESQDGNLGALLEDRELYERLLSTVAHTDSLLLDVQRHPRRYFKFSVF